jgi:hypothetical protein
MSGADPSGGSAGQPALSAGIGEGPGSGGAPPPEVAGGANQGSSPDSLNYIFEVAKDEVDSQFRISERIDSKARGLFTITAVIFGAAQALALRQDVLNKLGDSRDTVVTVAIVAGCLVGAALLATAITMFVRSDKSFESQPLFDWLNDLSDDKKPDTDVAYEVVAAYITLMHRRKERNVTRAKWLILVQILCIAGIGASILQLILALDGLA